MPDPKEWMDGVAKSQKAILDKLMELDEKVEKLQSEAEQRRANAEEEKTKPKPKRSGFGFLGGEEAEAEKG